MNTPYKNLSDYRTILNDLSSEQRRWISALDEIAPVWLFVGTAGLWGVTASDHMPFLTSLAVAFIRIVAAAGIIYIFSAEVRRKVDLKTSQGFIQQAENLNNDVQANAILLDDDKIEVEWRIKRFILKIKDVERLNDRFTGSFIFWVLSFVYFTLEFIVKLLTAF